MKIIKEYKIIIIIGLVLFVSVFYWFQIRPSNIRKNCIKEINYANLGAQYVQGKYKTCLATYGL